MPAGDLLDQPQLNRPLNEFLWKRDLLAGPFDASSIESAGSGSIYKVEFTPLFFASKLQTARFIAVASTMLRMNATSVVKSDELVTWQTLEVRTADITVAVRPAHRYLHTSPQRCDFSIEIPISRTNQRLGTIVPRTSCSIALTLAGNSVRVIVLLRKLHEVLVYTRLKGRR